MKTYTIHPLVVGVNETDQGIMTYLKDYGKRIILPIYVFYIKDEDKNILIDTGLEEFMIPEGVKETYEFDILEFEDALAVYDLKPEDI
ncbi:MAG: N-acyl homoserine lactonase family protein, partial [Deltaproteobacteria bacterium]|nr:N-acyl homoserine lactonase family protein [Deltaproteobacteria bacterium]